MNLTVDADSPVPPFEQLRVAIIEQIATGELATGTKLPTVRGLAGELGLAVNTVAKTYRALESDRFIETRGRLGSFISATGDAAHQQAQHAALKYAALTRRLGITDADAQGIIASAFEATERP